MKLRVIYGLVLSFFCFSLHADFPINRSDILYNQSGAPSKPLLKILKAFDVSCEENWQCITEETQKLWIQQNDRFHMEPPAKKYCPNKTFTLFSDLNMTQTFSPVSTSYKYGVVLGSSVQLVCQSLQFLADQWKNGVRFQKIVFLTGNRPLDSDAESAEVIQNCIKSSFEDQLPENETQMMIFLYNHMDLPAGLKQVKLQVVNTPQNDAGKRPNTRDTFVQWMRTNPDPGSTLIISNQPFIGRQDSIARHIIPPAFAIETVGKGFSIKDYKEHPFAQTLILDELARWIYEEMNGSYSY